MARPKVPLIERAVALDTALRIIDEEGLDALSIRRLADELGVNGASLYHHFTNKDAILVEATERALARTPLVILEVPSQDWRSMLLSGVTQLLDLLLSHPGLVPIIVQRRSMGMGTRMVEIVAGRLLAAGVPPNAIAPMFDALERFVVGWADREIAGEPVVTAASGSETPNLDLVLAKATFTSRQLFELCAIGIMNAITQAAQSHVDHVSEPTGEKPKRAARKGKAR